MTTILDGVATGATIRSEAAEAAATIRNQAGRAPGLAVVLVGDDPASQVYVGSKRRACEAAGLASFGHLLPADTPAAELFALIDRLNADPAVDGILVQLPLPAHLPTRELLERIDPAKDVDGFHPVNVGRLWIDEPGFVPCTPAGIIEMLRRYDIPLRGRRAVVIGRSTIVGKPMAGLLVRESATVTVAHSKTRDLPGLCREAEILIAAVGRAGLVDASYVAPGAVVIDVGMNRVSDRSLAERLTGGDEKRMAAFERNGSVLVGDVDYPAAAPLAAAITPVPGGVGPLTVAMLLANTVTAARRRLGLQAAAGG
ncbi:MAG: bifunctional methylenetetrahydrofolate dehydrogenase/methenyltetrahydrofolate cyclohydrolase FolD [Thermoanaerobaculia bacterium]|nr:MAG: bifunctional methylenetetrahydrofolate dehydrogenase/methenyltetrahydrofolate cyclohydrolase FolD [Thermoanaerobaculia bacterium]MBZ0103076.1 bifunctional methylenetetrahydrofolate dehydrogenase/methenyltetrahydrofolate cyclohydrolase FolD [Thermoanaerobaculia bacterium]